MATRDELDALHQEVLAGVPDASLRLFDVLQHDLPRVVRLSAGASYSLSDDEVADASADAFMAYLRAPEKFNPELASLQTYLSVIARSLLSRRRQRQARHEAIFDRSVELGPAGVYREELDPGSGDDPVRSLEAEQDRQLAEQYRKELGLSAQEDRVLTLMLDGERSTDVFAEALGLGDLPELERRRLVKRCKDMIDKRLRRLGGK